MNSKSRLIESLENRRLLSAVTLTAAGLLKVHGDGNAFNTISVATDGADPTMLDVNITGMKLNGTATKPLSQKFLGTSVTSLFIVGGNRADTIAVSLSNAMLIPTRVDGLAGADTITTGAESDTISGGPGNDTINSGGGNDIVRGGPGADAITVGDGNDKVHGGPGNDTITAGNGNDTITGGPGADSVVAGNGTDLLFGGTGNDTVTAGNGNDTIWGGQGDDVITAGNGDDTFGGILGHNTLMGGTGHDTFIVRKLANNVTSYNPAKDTLKLVGHEPGDPKI